MSKLKQCKSCKAEMATNAKQCPKCGAPNKKGGCLKFAGIGGGVFLLLVVIGGMMGGGSDDGRSVSNSNTGPSAEKESTFGIGQNIQTKKFEFSVDKVELRQSVGGEYFSSKPSEGAVYVAVTWNYKNISDKPIGAFSFPRIRLVDGNGVKYSADVSASGSYATEIDIDRKVLSDLNPGIKVNDGDVFEVSKEVFDLSSWTLLIDADQDVHVRLQ